MKTINALITIFLMGFLIFSSAGTVFAAANATISVAFDKDTVDVGDQVNLVVTIRNTGDQDLNNIFVLAPLPSGLNFLMSVTGTSKNMYDSNTGVWQVDNLRLTSQGGGVKTLKITAEVKSSLAGKSINANARFNSIAYGDPPVSILDGISSASSNTLTVKSTSNGSNNTENATDPNKSQNDANNDNRDVNKKITPVQAIKNATSDSGIEALQNLNTPHGNAYEITNATAPSSSDNSKTAYAVLGGLIIAAIIGIGYFKGIKG
jgi:uncharacterized repeat protein (TIGR01451 family)